ncbi:MAG: hypothetical protein EOO28_23360 [Comamonadaceae bacterium]|nr:MAG: hypothetical protein EOO28_23360 [Comamonadaceae bacterium]
MGARPELGAGSAWRTGLAAAGYAVVHDVALDGDNAALRKLGADLGAASVHGIRPGDRNAEDHGINRVEAMDQPRLDPAGRVILSTSADDFPLHTDDTFTADPVRYVLMHCWQPDPGGGGISTVAHVRDILAGLCAATLERLKVPDFPSPFGLAPVLFPAPGGAPGELAIRFNHRDFIGYGERFGPRITASQEQALDEVLALADRHATTFMLAAGDCVVVDNHRVLHGRTAFSPGSPRLIKRLRIR